LQNERPKNSSIDQIFAEAVETTDIEKEDQELLQKGDAVTPSTTMNKRDTRDRTHRNDATKSITNSKNFTPMLIDATSHTPMAEEAEDQSVNEVTEPKDTTILKPGQ